MKTILAPTDFSPVSLNAVNYAASMADAVNANLFILNVYQVPMTFSEVPYPPENIEEMIKASEDRLADIKDELLEKTGNRIKIHTGVATGVVLAEIEAYCETLKPFAVVMAAHGSNILETALFGSTTIAAIKQLSWPLVIVPSEAKFTSIEKIGLACDLKKVQETTPMKEIKALVQEFNAKLFVIHVNRETDPVYTSAIIDESGVLQRLLEDLHPSYHFLDSTDVEEGLSKFGEEHDLDLLIVVPRKHNVIENIFHRRHSKKMILHTHVPVMAIHE